MASTDSRTMLHPVILSGGVGSRLWPLSRALYPKQLLPLVSDRSMLQETLSRVSDSARFAPPVVICNEEHRFLVAEQAREAGIRPAAIVLEPEGRNTAPAVAVAALLIQERTPDALLLVLPSDHVIVDVAAFGRAIESAAEAARGGALVTFGLKPDRAETGYGYIQAGPSLAGIRGCHDVTKFVEKPGQAAAESMLKQGQWLWNGGMFLFSADAYLTELNRWRPEILTACRSAIEQGRQDMDFFRLDPGAFAAVPSDSIDYAVMENTEHAAVVPVDMGWNDIGSWDALWDVGDKDAEGNIAKGRVIAEDTGDSYIRTEGPLVATVGVRDMLIVATEDAVLVAPRARAQDVKNVVERLKSDGGQEHLSHVRVVRPWGSYQSVDAGARFQVKQLVVNPGAKLSLQKHRHRAEHWIVVSGTARVTRGEETFDLGVDQSTYIPIGTAHRLENPGTDPLRVIEVQSGDYLGEDDIIRFDDVYGRVDS